MKKHPILLFTTLLLLGVACKKSNSGGNTITDSGSYLSSVASYSSKSKIVDAFTYDSSHRILTFTQTKYDTTSGTPLMASWNTVFSYAGNSTTPSTYTYSDQSGTGGANGLHTLSYDNQGRITKDTCTNRTHMVTYYSYPDNRIVSNLLFDGTKLNNQLDSEFISNGNITALHVYYPNDAGTADSLSGITQISYSSTANPGYHPAIANAIGPLLMILQFDGYGEFADFTSKNAFNAQSGTAAGLPPGTTLNFTLTNDSQGRLSQVSLVFAGITAGRVVYTYY